MGRIIVISRKDDEHKEKINWLCSELKKRDLEVINPEVPKEMEENVWQEFFSKLENEFVIDTFIIVKGECSKFILKKIEENKIGLKGVFVIIDETNKGEILELDFEKIMKKIMKLFVYSFQSNSNFSSEKTDVIAQKDYIEFFILEGANDNSDYEDILADILSLEQSV